MLLSIGIMPQVVPALLFAAAATPQPPVTTAELDTIWEGLKANGVSRVDGTKRKLVYNDETSEALAPYLTQFAVAGGAIGDGNGLLARLGIGMIIALGGIGEGAVNQLVELAGRLSAEMFFEGEPAVGDWQKAGEGLISTYLTSFRERVPYMTRERSGEAGDTEAALFKKDKKQLGNLGRKFKAVTADGATREMVVKCQTFLANKVRPMHRRGLGIFLMPLLAGLLETFPSDAKIKAIKAAMDKIEGLIIRDILEEGGMQSALKTLSTTRLHLEKGNTEAVASALSRLGTMAQNNGADNLVGKINELIELTRGSA